MTRLHDSSLDMFHTLHCLVRITMARLRAILASNHER